MTLTGVSTDQVIHEVDVEGVDGSSMSSHSGSSTSTGRDDLLTRAAALANESIYSKRASLDPNPTHGFIQAITKRREEKEKNVRKKNQIYIRINYYRNSMILESTG